MWRLPCSFCIRCMSCKIVCLDTQVFVTDDGGANVIFPRAQTHGGHQHLRRGKIMITPRCKADVYALGILLSSLDRQAMPEEIEWFAPTFPDVLRVLITKFLHLFPHDRPSAVDVAFRFDTAATEHYGICTSTMHLTACIERGSGQTVSCMTQLLPASAPPICEVSFLRQKQPSAVHDEKFYAIAENGKIPPGIAVQGITERLVVHSLLPIHHL
ncbi:hypothetical protein DYB28_010104 [Aphanomyces astaci]|uniref:Protein kinase domain-containing protein n=2 Tax=Aphanomyces astaci TaxID=112090 RepID=A0A397BMD0_APHAT|nr:hypothetical protein DYB36_011349 [Aphanomyces astaci]RHY45782.1 hypothetical protein DYB38_010985 [Aphanomyces astaci]RHY47917.1 hypothetical protein DYB34_012132 [Aphanomyces astaci]RLO11299.1 hypothetical protein DYB28_010104 [Aphanomyces astaci]